ncbi:MAG: DUF2199 domain-containing protein [Hyphomicrobium sp.]|nr:DUF2199 domain-containing protein [Hyphomicrobium sp.]
MPALAFTTPRNLPPLNFWQLMRQRGYARDLYVDRETGGHYVRCVLILPIIDADEPLEWGVWSTLSEENFKRYRQTFGDNDQSKLGDMFGWFSSHCPGYPETAGLKCNVIARDGKQRPLIRLEPTDHPLAIDQRDGITLARAVELAAPWLRVMGHKV